MERDHLIRVAVGHLRGKQRDLAIEDILLHPEKVTEYWTQRLAPTHKGHRKPAKQVATPITVSLTWEQYKKLRATAKRSHTSMQQIVLSCLRVKGVI